MYKGALFVCLLSGCALQPSGIPTGLAGSAWQLEEFQSADDSIGIVTPRQSSDIELKLGLDGDLAVKLPCNELSGTWKTGDLDPKSGTLHISVQASAAAKCVSEPLAQQVERNLPFVRSFKLDGDRLYMSLFADGGIYSWKRIQPAN